METSKNKQNGSRLLTEWVKSRCIRWSDCHGVGLWHVRLIAVVLNEAPHCIYVVNTSIVFRLLMEGYSFFTAEPFISTWINNIDL